MNRYQLCALSLIYDQTSSMTRHFSMKPRLANPDPAILQVMFSLATDVLGSLGMRGCELLKGQIMRLDAKSSWFLWSSKLHTSWLIEMTHMKGNRSRITSWKFLDVLVSVCGLSLIFGTFAELNECLDCPWLSISCPSLYMTQRQHCFLIEFFLTSKGDQTLGKHFYQ